MSFSDHKITAFTHRIADLPDQPNLPADELKARFDACPEELRESVNGICDDAQTLSNKVDNIITQTFEGVVGKSMLSESLADELDAKATQTALSEVSADVTAEATARQSADSALSGRISSLESSVPQKAQVYYTTYTGTDGDRSFTLGFSPKMVFVSSQDYRKVSPSGTLAVPQGKTVYYDDYSLATLSGSTLHLYTAGGHNKIGLTYAILAIV